MKYKNPFPNLHNYDSPIDLIYNQISTDMNYQLDDAIYKQVLCVGIDIDKDKLLSALQQDSKRYREAFDKGYGEAKKNLYDVHDVAKLLTELFGDDCACNFNGIDEWLPYCCEYADECPNPKNGSCWEQFLIQKYRRQQDV